MKKTFAFTHPAHKPARVIEQIKSEVRKYLKRERRKALPEGADFWDFDCRTGASSDSAEPAHVSELTERIDQAASNQWPSIYMEIIAKSGFRTTDKES